MRSSKVSHLTTCSTTWLRLPVASPELQKPPGFHVPCCDALSADTEVVKIPQGKLGLRKASSFLLIRHSVAASHKEVTHKLRPSGLDWLITHPKREPGAVLLFSPESSSPSPPSPAGLIQEPASIHHGTPVAWTIPPHLPHPNETAPLQRLLIPQSNRSEIWEQLLHGFFREDAPCYLQTILKTKDAKLNQIFKIFNQLKLKNCKSLQKSFPGTLEKNRTSSITNATV